MTDGERIEIEGYRVVDAHVHVQPWEQLKPDVAKVMTAHRTDRPDIDRYIESPDAFCEHLDGEGIARAALINYPAEQVMGFDESVDDWVSAYRDARPDRIIAFGGFSFRLEPPDPKATVARVLDELRIDGIKIHPPHQLVDANAYLDGHQLMREIYAGCQERGVPVLIHTGTSVFPGARGKHGDPMHCDDIAVDFPELKLILAHAGRPLWMDAAVHLARRHRNVLLDLSGIPPKSLLDYLPRLERLAPKCLWGTDWPSPGVRSMRANVLDFLELPLGEDAKRRILAGTADELFPPRDGGRS